MYVLLSLLVVVVVVVCGGGDGVQHQMQQDAKSMYELEV